MLSSNVKILISHLGKRESARSRAFGLGQLVIILIFLGRASRLARYRAFSLARAGLPALISLQAGDNSDSHFFAGADSQLGFGIHAEPLPIRNSATWKRLVNIAIPFPKVFTFFSWPASHSVAAATAARRNQQKILSVSR
jgi:hypothetical protein